MILCQKIKFFVAGALEPFCFIFGRLGFALFFRVRLGPFPHGPEGPMGNRALRARGTKYGTKKYGNDMTRLKQNWVVGWRCVAAELPPGWRQAATRWTERCGTQAQEQGWEASSFVPL